MFAVCADITDRIGWSLLILFLEIQLIKKITDTITRKSVQNLGGKGCTYSVTFWVGVCRWDSETLTLYQTMFSWADLSQGKVKLVWVSREFKLTKFELADSKLLNKRGQIQGKLDFVWVSGGFYCIDISKDCSFARMKHWVDLFYYPRYWKAFPTERFYYVTARSITTCSRWVFADTRVRITPGLNSGSTSIALTNQVTIRFTRQVSLSYCSITLMQTSACIMNPCCWSRSTEVIQYPYRISVAQRSATRQLIRESMSFLCRNLWRFFWENFITKFRWRERKRKVHKHQHQGKDLVCHFTETSNICTNLALQINFKNLLKSYVWFDPEHIHTPATEGFLVWPPTIPWEIPV